jgi:putative membrane protein
VEKVVHTRHVNVGLDGPREAHFMIRFLVSTLVAAAASAVGLLVAAWVLDDMSVSGAAFLVAVAIFTVTVALVGPFLQKRALKSAQALMGATALLATLIGLIVTHLVSDGLSIKGLSTWFYATFIVWFAGLIAAWIIPMILVKRGVQSARENR